MYHVYILRSIPTGRFYIGSTGDIIERLSKHNKGYTKATRPYAPWKLVQLESFPNKSDAIKREYEIKRMKSRSYIEHLISHGSVNTCPLVSPSSEVPQSNTKVDRLLSHSPGASF